MDVQEGTKEALPEEGYEDPFFNRVPCCGLGEDNKAGVEEGKGNAVIAAGLSEQHLFEAFGNSSAEAGLA